MVTTPLPPQFRVLISDHGRHCLWPAAKPIPPAWREALPASSKEECLAFVGGSFGSADDAIHDDCL